MTSSHSGSERERLDDEAVALEREQVAHAEQRRAAQPQLRAQGVSVIRAEKLEVHAVAQHVNALVLDAERHQLVLERL